MSYVRPCVVVLGLLVACSSEEEVSCPSPSACDIREASCQAHAAALAACLRGDEPANFVVPVDIVDSATPRAQLRGGLRAAGDETDAVARAFELLGLVTPEPTEPVGIDNAHTLQLIPDAFDAWYDRRTGRISVRDRGRPLDSNEALALLVHEMTHAIQDELGAFEVLDEAQSLDMHLARLAMLEGDATLAGLRTSIELAKASERTFNWQNHFAAFQASEQTKASGSRNLLEDSILLFPYAWGGAYVQNVRAGGDYEAVNALFADDAPYETATVLGLDVTASDLDAHATPELAAPLTRTDVVHLGSWIARRYLDRFSNTKIPVLRDALSVFTRPRATGEDFDTVAYWRLEFASASDARTVAAALDEGDDGARRAMAIDDEVVISVSDGDAPEEPEVWSPHGRADS